MIDAGQRLDLLDHFMPSGAFRSYAHLPSGPVVADGNAFVTALVLQRLAGCSAELGFGETVDAAIAFLQRCENPTGSGRFCFYPAGGGPAWIGETLPPDADDTALCSLALFELGLWSRERLRAQLHEVLGIYRIPARPRGAPWFRAGTYPTWLLARRLRNPIDVCVNVNVLALIEASGAGRDYGAGIVDMVAAALDWVGDSRERARLVMPYYPDPGELVHALARAVRFGSAEAAILLRQVQRRSWSISESGDEAPVCGSVGANVVWTCPALQRLRSVAHDSRVFRRLAP